MLLKSHAQADPIFRCLYDYAVGWLKFRGVGGWGCRSVERPSESKLFHFHRESCRVMVAYDIYATSVDQNCLCIRVVSKSTLFANRTIKVQIFKLVNRCRL